MEISAYREMARIEVDHWFWIGRRSVIRQSISNLNSESMDILEIGSGTGGNVELLNHFGSLTAVELEELARKISLEKFPSQIVLDGSLPNNINLPDESFDLVCLFDVLEHIDDSKGALERINRLLRPGGKVMITVPAYEWMWSKWDELHHHKRRYTRSRLSTELIESGFKLNKLSHFNTFLFPLILTTRVIIKFFNLKGGAGHGTPPKLLNSILSQIIKFESYLMNYFNLPFGVSILSIAEKSGKN